jgi:hypothetical protein
MAKSWIGVTAWVEPGSLQATGVTHRDWQAPSAGPGYRNCVTSQLLVPFLADVVRRLLLGQTARSSQAVTIGRIIGALAPGPGAWWLTVGVTESAFRNFGLKNGT